MGDQTEFVRNDRLIRAVRWVCVPFAVIPSVLYEPPSGTDVPFDPLTFGGAIASALILVNIGSIVASRTLDVRGLVWTGRAQLAADTLIVFAVFVMFRSDVSAASWSVLILPVIEAATRDGLRGAVTTWAACGAAYIAVELTLSRLVPITLARVGSYAFRLELMFLVALATGALARSLRAKIIDHLDARRESERRAELLRIVAGTGKKMSTPEAEQVISAVVDACVQMGFEASSIIVLNELSGTFKPAASRGFDPELTEKARSSSDGLIGVVRTERKTIVIDDYSNWEHAVPDARSLGLRAVVATPIWLDHRMHAILTMATRRRTSVSCAEIEAFELLAAHAGAALATANHFSQRRALQKRLHHEALHDALTGLPNRTLFRDRLNHCLERKATDPSPTAVALVALDGFKHVNDSHGQSVGDEILQVVSERLRSVGTPGDTVARYGGDQFAVLFEYPESERAVMDVAGTIVEELSKPIAVGSDEIFVSASVGVAFRYELERLARDFLREADLAVRRAKERGGGRVEGYRPAMWTRVDHRSEMEQELRRALKRDELAVYYQPGISLETGELVGLEALVRWRHPTRGVIVADEFISFAQDCGLLVAVGQRLLEEVGAQISVWRATGAVPPVPVGVNLSAIELAQDDFVPRVISVLDTHRLHPKDIIFEVTESVVMSDDEKTRTHIDALRRTGVRLAIDDFGLGYSSLSYLKRFPFAVLKIDRSFVTDVDTNETDQAIVRYILGLARDLSMPVIAEGVETRAQMAFLRASGCRFAQGYYICEPVNPLRLRQLIDEGLLGVRERESTAAQPESPFAATA